MPTVLIGGGTGLVGTRLSQMLTEKGYAVCHLSRGSQSNSPYPVYYWDAQNGEIDQEAVDGADFIINLAGAGIADRLWSDQRKKLIIASRVDTTDLLHKAIQRSTNPPKAFISSSATGYYGSRGDQVMTEQSGPGDGFLSESCLAWEAAIDQVAGLGIRTVVIRTGVVLSTEGGALPKMIIPIHFFTGVYFGNGRQWLPWIHIDDLCRIFIYAIERDQLSGTFNGVAPNPEINRDFMAQVATVKKQPVIMVSAPGLALKVVLGEMSHTVLDSTSVSSAKIEEAGFVFDFPFLPGALADLFQRKI